MFAVSAGIPRIVLTPGEPAGIGPELTVRLAARAQDAQLVAVADRRLLAGAAADLDIPLALTDWDPDAPPARHRPGELPVAHCPLAEPVEPGHPSPANARHVLQTLERACDACLDGRADALVTGPVHKGVINRAGVPFTGHTEFLARRCGADRPVMMLAGRALRVVLVTTHLPLARVPAAITAARVDSVLRITAGALATDFGVAEPRLAVLGLNPHAGEDGHLGTEEREVITPVLERLRGEGFRLEGPLPADTAFTPGRLARTDAFVAMYHDQGLAVLKYASFGEAVNITLGLPIVRTSVDHGTGLDIAGRGGADAGSLQAAFDRAVSIARRRRP